MDDYLVGPLRDFMDLFERMQIPYVLIGGMAVSVHGIPRPTHALDFTIDLDRNLLTSLFKVAMERGYAVSEEHAAGWVDTVGGMPLVRIRQWLHGRAIDIDLFLAESAFQESMLARRMQVDVEGASAWIASPEDLILLKIIAGRPRDIGDVMDIVLAQVQLDLNYMQQWADVLCIRPLLDTTLSEVQ